MNAQMSKKIVFWLDTLSGQIKMGLPEEYPAPAFHEKIVCGSVFEAERWSHKMRRQEAEREAQEDAKRDEIEERMRANHRSHILHLMANARNNINREFLRRHLELYDARPDRTKSKRESYLHAEAFEKGH
jgi:hypothetical protein